MFPYPKSCDGCIGRYTTSICFPCERHGICEKCCRGCERAIPLGFCTNTHTHIRYNDFSDFGHLDPQITTMRVCYIDNNGVAHIREE